MTQIPKIPQSVIARLLAGSSAPGEIGTPHPDANLLSAFSENSLEKRERAEVLEHLAGCPQCRDVLALQALAAAQMGEEAAPSKAPQHARGWLSKTELRWAAVAASLAVVAGIVLLRPPDRLYQDRIQSSSATAPPQSQVAKTKDRAPAENKVEMAKQDKKRRDTVPENQISREATSLTSSFGGPPPPPGPSGSASSAGSSIAQPWEDSLAANAKHPAALAPPASARAAAAKTAPMRAPAATAATANDNFDREVLKDELTVPAPPALAKEKNSTTAASAPAVSANNDASLVVNQSQPPTATPYEGQSAARAAAEGRNPKSGMQSANTITTSAAADSVSTEPASATRKSGVIGGVVGFDSMSKLPARVPPAGERWRVDQGMLQLSENAGQTWSSVAPGFAPGPPGLIITRLGQEVWAGDSQGGLSHSLDGGQHWQRVLYGGTENIAGATIVSVAIPSPAQVIIRNSAGVSWVTRDNGKTWRMK